MSDSLLRKQLIRLAHSKPELRGELLPLLKTGGGPKWAALTPGKARDAVNKLKAAGIEASIRKNYSGRGMAGKTVTGVILNSKSDTDQAIREVPALKGMAQDSIGMGVIFY